MACTQTRISYNWPLLALAALKVVALPSDPVLSKVEGFTWAFAPRLPRVSYGGQVSQSAICTLVLAPPQVSVAEGMQYEKTSGAYTELV